MERASKIIGLVLLLFGCAGSMGSVAPVTPPVSALSEVPSEEIRSVKIVSCGSPVAKIDFERGNEWYMIFALKERFVLILWDREHDLPLHLWAGTLTGDGLRLQIEISHPWTQKDGMSPCPLLLQKAV